jgi:hypothetical protein
MNASVLKPKLLWLKSKLSFIGDLLFVRETPVDVHSLPEDQAAKFDRPDKVLSGLKSENIEVLRITYERAKDFEREIAATADHVRDKAKTLFSTGSFVSGVLFGVSALFVTAVSTFSSILVIIHGLLFTIVFSHFIRAFFLAMIVMTKEESVQAGPSEYLVIANKKKESTLLREAISQRVAYANQTHEYLRKRSNKLIVAQTSFRYGLIYFLILVLFHFFSYALQTKELSTENWSRLDSLTSVTARTLTETNTVLESISRELSDSNKAQQSIVEQLKRIRSGLDTIALVNKGVRKAQKVVRE